MNACTTTAGVALLDFAADLNATTTTERDYRSRPWVEDFSVFLCTKRQDLVASLKELSNTGVVCASPLRHPARQVYQVAPRLRKGYVV